MFATLFLLFRNKKFAFWHVHPYSIDERNNRMRAEFKDRLDEAIKIRKINASQLSEKTGISRSSISRYLSGNYSAGQTNTYKIASALNVDYGWLMGGDCEMVPKHSVDYVMHLTDDEILLFEQYRKADDERKRFIKYAVELNK